MGFSFSVKEIKNGKWHHVGFGHLTGKTWLQALEGFEGTEAVAEFIFDDEKIYFCGTDKWLNRMSENGKAMRFAQIAKLPIDKNDLAWLNNIVPCLEDIDSIFGGVIKEVVVGEKK